MDEGSVIEIGREAVIVLLKLSLPLMLVAMAVGLIISLFQALTQIQEMTLSFVPKIVAVFLAMLLLLPFYIRTLTEFTESIFGRMVGS